MAWQRHVGVLGVLGGCLASFGEARVAAPVRMASIKIAPRVLPWMSSTLSQSLEAGDDVEQILRNILLAFMLVCAPKSVPNVLDVALSAQHRGKTRAVLARERFRAGAKEPDEGILSHQS
jgi:hypothetical protein